MSDRFRDPFKARSSPVYLENDENTSEDSDVPPSAFPGHRDTLALIRFRRQLGPASSIPSELLELIYRYLSPIDFHAARHASKSWYLASLDKSLLKKMTRRSGCSQAAREDLQCLPHTLISEEWLLSKRLSTEAKVTPGAHLHDAPLTIREEIDFRVILLDSEEETIEPEPIRRFTVSSCGRFLLVSTGETVHVFTIWPSIRPVTTLSCRRQVLAVSMDTRSNRYTIAVLLESRMGMCWDLDMAVLGPVDTDVLCSSRSTAVYEQIGSPDDLPRSVAICPQRRCVAFGCSMGIELHWIDALTGSRLTRWFPLAAPSDSLFFLPQRSGESKKLRLISSAHGGATDRLQPDEETSSASLQSTGVNSEIPGSSARGRPMEHPTRQSMTRLFFGSMPFPSATTSIVRNIWPETDQNGHSDRQGVLRTVDCDHHQALPLSDGIHVLFTDPKSGLLCLGSDAPLGSRTKLIRKFVFLPPGYVSTTTKLRPVCYGAAQNLQWGIRVAVVYVDGSLVLFNIPSDCFERVKNIRSTPDVWDEGAGVIAQSDLLMDVLMVEYPLEQARTIQVPGLQIASLEVAVDDICILCQGGGVRIWIFQANGIARCWDILQTRQITARRVAGNGTIEDVGKGKAREVDQGVHVHFSVDGTEDAEIIQRSVAVGATPRPS